MISAQLGSADAPGAAETGSDYLATEAHYLSVAKRSVSMLREAGRFVLVTGDPSPDPHLFLQALRAAAESCYTITPISGDAETSLNQQDRGESVIATLASGGEILTAPQTTQGAPPRLLLGKLDALSDLQIRQICEAAQEDPRGASAGMLLGHSGFLRRLEEPSLQCLKDAPIAQLAFEEIGQDEAIDFLRHQLSTRHLRKEARGVPPAMLRGLAAFGMLLAVGAAGLVLFNHIHVPGEPAAHPASITPQPSDSPGALSTASHETSRQYSTMPEKGSTEGAGTPMVLHAVPSDAVTQPEARLPQSTPSSAAPSTGQSSASAGATLPPLSTPPMQSLATQHPSRAEIAVLMTRGDDFLKAGDIASARLFYERAADAGDGAAALRLGATFDPGFLARAGIRGAPGDPTQAASWYRRARDLGEAAAAQRLKSLTQPPLVEPGVSAR